MDIFLIIILMLVLGIIIISLVVINKIKNVTSSIGGGKMNLIFDAIKSVKKLEKDEYARQKDVSGMTTLVEPRILEDFPDFNKELLYAKVEANLTKIFNAIEEKDISKIKNDSDFDMIYSFVEEKIQDLIGISKNVKYDLVKFHRHALKKYAKSNGKATISVSSTLEYYYSEDGNKKISKVIDGIKKQTRFTTEFVYIYDESTFDPNQMSYAENCPNCGAPLSSILNRNCKFCGTYVEPINLKVWKMSSYKEDYE